MRESEKLSRGGAPRSIRTGAYNRSLGDIVNNNIQIDLALGGQRLAGVSLRTYRWLPPWPLSCDTRWADVALGRHPRNAVRPRRQSLNRLPEVVV